MNNITERERQRFGHSINKINDFDYFLFGGAVESTPTQFNTTNDSFLINKTTLLWTKLSSNLIRLRSNPN